jgi:hypothetical protein
MPTSSNLVHVSITQFDSGFVDAEFGPIDATPRSIVFQDKAIEILPAQHSGTINLKQSGFYMCAEPNRQSIEADRTVPSVWEAFLPMDDTDLIVLRWMVQNQGGLRPRIGRDCHVETDIFWPGLRPPFTLQIGTETIDLTKGRPTIRSCTLPNQTALSKGLVFECVDNSEPRSELALTPAPVDPLPLVDRAAFLETTSTALKITTTPEDIKLPITVDPSAIEFIRSRYWNNAAIPLGPQSTTSEVRRSRGKYVLLQHSVSGIIFDEEGTYSNIGYFNTLQACPPGLRRSGDTIMIDRQLMRGAVSVPGTCAVIFNPHLRNYYHWMVECMLSLDMVARNLPDGTKIILPGEVGLYRANGATGFDHRRIIDLLGFGHIPVIELDAEVCHLEEAVWIENYMIHDIPADAVCKFRDRVRRRLGRNLPRSRRVYILRANARGIANDDEVRAFCEENGFIAYRLEHTDDEEQIRIFQEAEFVIAPHGAGLSNLMFCEPGTKVIELCPDILFGPFFWQISEKLGLFYGLLPCRTSDGTFQGKMTVEVEQLRALFTILEGRM